MTMTSRNVAFSYRIETRQRRRTRCEAVLRFEQQWQNPFEFPVTVTLQYRRAPDETDRRVQVAGEVTEHAPPAAG